MPCNATGFPLAWMVGESGPETVVPLELFDMGYTPPPPPPAAPSRAVQCAYCDCEVLVDSRGRCRNCGASAKVTRELPAPKPIYGRTIER